MDTDWEKPPNLFKLNYCWRMKDQLDVTCYFISLLMCSTTKRQNTSHQTHTTIHHKFTLTLNHPSLQNKTTDVVIHQHNRKLLMMDILMSETCWAHKKWNKIASDMKLVFHSSTNTMMHGPINICNYCISSLRTKMCQFTCTEQEAPDSSQAHRPLVSCCYLVSNFCSCHPSGA